MNMRMSLLGGGLLALVAGIALWVYGYNVEPTAGQAIGNIFTGDFTDKRNVYMIMGLIAGGVGAAGLLSGFFARPGTSAVRA